MGLFTLILEIILFLIIFIIILLLIFLYVGLDINIFLNKKENGFKGHIEVKWSFIKIFSKNFPDIEENNKDSKNKDSKNNKDFKNGNNKVNNNINTKDTDDEDSNDEKKEKNDKKDKKSKNKWNEFKTLFPLIKINFWDIIDLIKSILSSIELKRFKTHLILGFSSPVDTATILGYIWAFSATPNMHKSFSLSAEPVFNREIMNFKGEISFKINLLKPALKIFKLLTKKSMIKLILKSRKLFKND